MGDGLLSRDYTRKSADLHARLIAEVGTPRAPDPNRIAAMRAVTALRETAAALRIDAQDYRLRERSLAARLAEQNAMECEMAAAKLAALWDEGDES